MVNQRVVVGENDENPEWTEEDFRKARSGREVFAELGMKPPRGRPKAEVIKERVTLRLDPDILRHFRSFGPGWQTRMNDALRDVVSRASDAQPEAVGAGRTSKRRSTVEYYQDKRGEWRWRMVDTTGRVLSTASEGHRSKTDAQSTARTRGSDKWEFYEDHSGAWRWRRLASNGKIVGQSAQTYSERAAAERDATIAGYKPKQALH